LSPEEQTRLLAACKESNYPALHLIVVLALSTGMRRGELLGLKWRDVDWEGRSVLLHHTKNGERRRVPVPQFVIEMLQEHAKVRVLGSDFVFPSIRESPKMNCRSVPMHQRPIDIKKPWATAVKKAGLWKPGDPESFRFHDLRHSCASYLAMSGSTPVEIAAVLGHKSLQMVKRYAHLSESHVGTVVARMAEKFIRG
jgi:integrase